MQSIKEAKERTRFKGGKLDTLRNSTVFKDWIRHVGFGIDMWDLMASAAIRRRIIVVSARDGKIRGRMVAPGETRVWGENGTGFVDIEGESQPWSQDDDEVAYTPRRSETWDKGHKLMS